MDQTAYLTITPKIVQVDAGIATIDLYAGDKRVGTTQAQLTEDQVSHRTFPSMPPAQPVTRDGDNLPDIRIEGDSVILVGRDETTTLIGHGILKGSIIVQPGSDYDINKVTLTLFAGRIDIGDNHDDIRVTHESRVFGSHLTEQRWPQA